MIGNSKIKKEWKLFKKNMPLLSLSLPAVIYTFVFAYLPLIFLIVAFKDFRYDKGLWGSEWVGFENFEFFFTSQTAFTITRNTILYNLTFIILTTVIAVAIAVLMNEVRKKWIKVHQTILFLPYFLSWVVVGYIAQSFLDYDNGLINQLLADFGFDPIRWYQEQSYWPFIIILVHLWKSIGFSSLIYYSGIMAIDSSYYEAAKIDGASKLQMIRSITIPLIMPLIIILFIVEMGKIFRADFGLFYFIPNDVSFLYNATDVIDTYVYRSLRVVGDIGMATAVGLYQSIVGLLLVLLTNYIIKKINKDHALW
ncbi:sugar ABC transporter permease [Bacillaceae bacterium SIJ1]|nr:sugar ABC transporter permease [Litoribacterium kuwaitense]